MLSAGIFCEVSNFIYYSNPATTSDVICNIQSSAYCGKSVYCLKYDYQILWRLIMGKIINATEAVRAFSEIINSVKYKGESYTIIRGGKPAATIMPVKVATPGRTLKELRAIINKLPKLGKDTERFLKDVEEAIQSQPPIPETTAWE